MSKGLDLCRDPVDFVHQNLSSWAHLVRSWICRNPPVQRLDPLVKIFLELLFRPGGIVLDEFQPSSFEILLLVLRGTSPVVGSEGIFNRLELVSHADGLGIVDVVDCGSGHVFVGKNSVFETSDGVIDCILVANKILHLEFVVDPSDIAEGL